MQCQKHSYDPDEEFVNQLMRTPDERNHKNVRSGETPGVQCKSTLLKHPPCFSLRFNLKSCTLHNLKCSPQKPGIHSTHLGTRHCMKHVYQKKENDINFEPSFGFKKVKVHSCFKFVQTIGK